ncbi:PAS domain-containing protein [Paenibacillus sp. P26]|nr:PAS domain-containing protein [Paenibacillus sp. P26]
MNEPITAGNLPAWFGQERSGRSGLEEMGHALFHHSKSGQAVLDMDCTLLTVNASLAGSLGYPPEQLRGMSLHALIHPGEPLLCMHHMSWLVERRLSLYEAEVRLLHAGGEPISALLTACEIQDKGERFIHLEVHSIDGQRKAEAALRDYAALTPDLLDLLPAPYMILGRDWRFLQVNRAARRLLRRNRDELIGQPVWTALPELANTPSRRPAGGRPKNRTR